jgi:hypothetical protein
MSDNNFVNELFNIRAEYYDDQINTITLFKGNGYSTNYNKTDNKLRYKKFPPGDEDYEFIILDDNTKLILPPDF